MKAGEYFVGVDGEGQGRTPHRYVLLAWSNADGSQRDYVHAPKGLTTEECLEFLLSIPRSAKAFAYSFGYDLTKILADVDAATLYRLFRPELRQREGKDRFKGPKAVPWFAPVKPRSDGVMPHEGRGQLYFLNLQGTKFTVSRASRKVPRPNPEYVRAGLVPKGPKRPRPDRTVVWDVFKFFQSKFTGALEAWKVGNPEELERMREMKDQRAQFDRLSFQEILSYCHDECAKMAQLAQKLVLAHAEAGLELKSFYGAGSTGGAILKLMGIHEQKRDGLLEMKHAVASAFFGGRFENSVIGEVEGPLYSYDISSAYPYESTFLPCLGCGRWRLTRERVDLEGSEVRAACVRYSLGSAAGELRRAPWGPFPFRERDSSICFPIESGGGWVWLAEYLAGEKLFPHVQFREAWVYESSCDHQPFRSIPHYYRTRLKLGKDGAGIVIKLGINSVYGKLAQSVGIDPPFQSWIWAGMVTSGTRAQILGAMGAHRDRSNLLMVATDGICSRERLSLASPRDTGTWTDEHKKPLGGWEGPDHDPKNILPKGMFLMRPGIYFPLGPSDDDLKRIKARGVGRAAMFAGWTRLVESWRRREPHVELARLVRFAGAKTSIGLAHDPVTHRRLYRRRDEFGEWVERPVVLSFNPRPKRERWTESGETSCPLDVRRLPRELESRPYDRSIRSEDAKLLAALAEEALEQPDGGDFAEYEEAV